jgi:hypothetical protein
MSSHEEALACILGSQENRRSNGTTAALTVDWAHENTVLIVTNLPLNTTLDEIHQQFGQFGEIDEAASDEGVRRKYLFL